ncbi:MAG TPA: CRISPR-associated helicase Cas3' [Candidatus Dormibacteraeota bacterium]|nr:CRISPR-associated helicase Cas3' [Candidatus Dormibacteraeota bacterium]
MPPLFEFWAKSGRDGEPAPMHSVPHHSLDVAACALVLLEAYRAPAAVPNSTLAALVAFHDVGKFTRPFQAKVPALWPPSLGPFSQPPPGFHDDAGYALLCGALKRFVDPLFADWKTASSRYPLFRAVTGHHGRPPREFDTPELGRKVACGVCLDAAGAFITQALGVINPPPLPQLDNTARQHLAWFLAGLAVAADWLGSGREWFQPVVAEQHRDLHRYWCELALPRARQAVADAHLLPSTVAQDGGLSGLFPGLSVRPLQAWAEVVPIPDGPALFTIEDATGAGKTETALVLAHRLMAAGRADGLFFALPTMATANAMYARLGEAYRRLFAAGSSPSLVLSHGRRSLHEGFTTSILDAAADPQRDPPEPADQTAGAQCAAWIADDRRKAFLAEIGVGTVDQAIMAVLPSRHAPLRLLGLSRRVLIVDEAHAYDAYMTKELHGLLAFQAALGGSAILLSATLTARQRGELQAAFLAGLGSAATSADASTKYPLTTTVSRDRVSTQACSIAPDLARRVVVERLADRGAALASIRDAAQAGAAVGWIRNAVDDAIEAVEALRAVGLDASLFHARFAMGDRQDIETRVLNWFGRSGSPGARNGRVLVATQVVEQSLDLDFDLVVTDLAPADLIIQRAGRLWRHRRDDRPIAGPRLLLLAPEPVDDPVPAWLGAELRRTGFVYPDHALLWRSARALLGRGYIETPDGIRELVEAAYDRDAPNSVPPGLAVASNRADGNEIAATGVAFQNVLRLDEPYDRRSGLWEPDVRTPTRLGEAQIVFRLAREQAGAVVPWYANEETRRAWALSEVSLRATRIRSSEEDQRVERLKKDWPAWDRDIPVLLLQPDGTERWSGTAIDPRGQRRTVTYSTVSGLVFSA